MADHSPECVLACEPEPESGITCYLCNKKSKNKWDRNRFHQSLQEILNTDAVEYRVHVHDQDTLICQSCYKKHGFVRGCEQPN